jgi:hypothetical protein
LKIGLTIGSSGRTTARTTEAGGRRRFSPPTLDAPQRPLTRDHLLQATRVHEDVLDRSIDVQMLRLRRKLEADPSTPNIIRTERGVGYVFTLPVERP